MELQDKFDKYIHEQKLFKNTQKILVAVSGGVDSMVLCDLLIQKGVKIGLAHCNFKLRGKESDLDETFVRKTAKKHKVEFFCKEFNTQQYALQNKISVQVAARNLRYQWFKQLLIEKNYDYIATAHHLNDSIETVLLNLIRGTGLAGLHGILPKNNDIIRPLLFATKENIYEYARQNKIEWREDKSNQKDLYKRNFLRNRVIPLIKQLNLGFDVSFSTTIEKLTWSEMFYYDQFQNVEKKVIEEREGYHCIDLNNKKFPFENPVLLMELLKKYNVNYELAKKISQSYLSSPGKRYITSNSEIILDRKKIIITPLAEGYKEGNRGNRGIGYSPFSLILPILKDSDEIHTPSGILRIKYVKKSKKYQYSTDSTAACLDKSILKFPLVLRSWKTGDYFYPLGLKGRKKISDFLIDYKIPRNLKKNIFVLESDSKICWVVGYRIDDRFKITTCTKFIVEFAFEKGK